MSVSKVYFTDFHTKAFGDGLPTKLKKLIKRAALPTWDLEGKFVAIKMHFGEPGNLAYLRPNWARAVVDLVKVPRRQALLDGLQYPVSGQSKTCPGTLGLC